MTAVLQAFGGYFLGFILIRHGYDKMFKALCPDFVSLITNLDSLHSMLTITYPHMQAPTFRYRCHQQLPQHNANFTTLYYTCSSDMLYKQAEM